MDYPYGEVEFTKDGALGSNVVRSPRGISEGRAMGLWSHASPGRLVRQTGRGLRAPAPYGRPPSRPRPDRPHGHIAAYQAA
jgi:hypothetical protein